MKRLLWVVVVMLWGCGIIGLAEAAMPVVSMVTEEGLSGITSVSGHFKSVAVPIFGFRRFIEFVPIPASHRSSDPRPELILEFDEDPHEAYWLVKLKSWPEESAFVLDLDSPSVWEGSAATNEPEEDSNIPYKATEEEGGIWRITPIIALESGEYGLFRWGKNNSSKSILYRFGVDR